MKPIMEVAVKNAPISPWAGRIPTKENGMAAMITNGVRLADAGFAHEVAAAGVSDFLLSLQGSCPQSHDGVTGLPGSFKRLVQGIENQWDKSIQIGRKTFPSGITVGFYVGPEVI